MHNHEEKSGRRKQKLEILRLALVGVALLISIFGLAPFIYSIDAAVLFALIVGGTPILKSAILALRAKSVTAEVAMASGMIASIAVGQYLSACVIAFFMLIAEFIDEFTREKSKAAISKLMMTPKTATANRNDQEISVEIDELRQGDTVIAKSGEMIPVDGVVINGHGLVNQAPITGESMPVEKNVGDDVFAGTVNQLGTMQIEVTKVGKDTTLARIIQLVEEAETSKAPIQKIADRFASRFMPIVFFISALTFVFTRDITNSISVIVVACPCAVALATPLAVVAGIGNAARKGIIIKGGVYLEELAKTDTIIVDKTGTLTIGEPTVTDIKCFDEHCQNDILSLAACAEQHSEHPLASAIINKAKKLDIKVTEHSECSTFPGKGVIAKIGNQLVILGNREMLAHQNIRVPRKVENYMKEKEKNGETALLVAHDKEVCALISVADVVRKEATYALKELEQKGIRLIMVTGDNPRTAQGIAKQVEINEVYAEMLPEEKVEKVKEFVSQGRKVAMVGDGINDAPALAEASVGIAMGTIGTDVAIEAADVTLMTDDLTKIAEAINLGRKTFSVIKQNLAASIVFNIVGVSLASMGILNPLIASFAHSLPDLILFLNSSRLIRSKTSKDQTNILRLYTINNNHRQDKKTTRLGE